MSSASVERPHVSVVIPCYNYGRYLGEAIESVLDQTLPPDEILVIDDGSTDNTREVAARYSVHLLSQSNQGACRTFNNGIRASMGEFFALLSADDLFRPTYLEKTVPVLAGDSSLAFVYTGFELFGAECWVHTSREYDLESLMRENYVHGSALMRRAAFDKVGGFNENMRHGYEDWDLYLAFAEAGWKGRLVPEPLLMYRRHSVTSRDLLSHQHWRAVRTQIRRNHPGLFTRSYRAKDFVRRGLHIATWHMRGWALRAAAVARRSAGLGSGAKH